MNDGEENAETVSVTEEAIGSVSEFQKVKRKKNKRMQTKLLGQFFFFGRWRESNALSMEGRPWKVGSCSG